MLFRSNTAGHRYDTKTYTYNSGSFDQQFHLYSLLWNEAEIRILIDDQEYYYKDKTSISEAYPFNNPFFFIFNIAIGGTFIDNEIPDASTGLPQRMVVDYIRVYQ